ncbi:hypothetical protein FACS1894163_06050 [Spirochaetia bacterium]|nr:hypothetical protein FACS1894163_06050 [Spirochaetia bacterium]
MRLYHGGMEMVEQPHIIQRIHSRTTDFGPGFYTTTDYDQAKKWVEIRRARGQTEGGFVSIFEAPDNLLQNPHLKRLVFTSADHAWLDFVMNNRNHPGFIHDYDIVAGPVANDRVYAALSLYEEAFLDIDETIRRLKTYKLVNQILFSTEKSIQELVFIEGKQV